MSARMNKTAKLPLMVRMPKQPLRVPAQPFSFGRQTDSCVDSAATGTDKCGLPTLKSVAESHVYSVPRRNVST